MSTPVPVIFASAFVASLLSAPRERGADVEGLLRAAGIDPQLPQDVQHHVTVDQYAALLRKTMVSLGDEGFALFSRKLRRGSFAHMVRAALAGGTLVGALHEFLHTLYLLQDDLTPVLQDDGRRVRVELHFNNPDLAARHFAHELILRLTWRLMAWLEGGHLRPVGIDLAFPRPDYADDYRKIFPTELRFGTPYSTIWFDSQAMQAPVRRNSSNLRDYLDKALLDLLVPAIPARISDRVRAYLQEEHTRHSTWPNLTQTSSALHCSGSSLQRHLAQENASFQHIRDHLRRDWAIYRLQTTRLSIPQLAEELDFADSASFQRAFKRWTGRTPGQVRKGR
jgi:AraC-like DNA-binding protein